MRPTTLATLLLLVVPAVLPAQSGLPAFAFGGRRLGDARSLVAPAAECTTLTTHGVMCTGARTVLGAARVDVGWYFQNDSLAGIAFRVDSGGFDGVLPALKWRYGAPARVVRKSGHDYAEWRFKDGRLHLTRTGSAANEIVVGSFSLAK